MTDNELLAAISIMMDQKLEPIKAELVRVNVRLDALEHRMDTLEHRMDTLENRMDAVESDISALKKGQNRMCKEIKEMHIKVSVTYELALDAWGQSTENRELLKKM